MTHDLTPSAPGPRPQCPDFNAQVRDLVLATAPRLFAVVQVLGAEEDARVAAWGMAHQDESRFDIVSAEGNTVLRLGSLERTGLFFGRRPSISAHVEWL